MGTVVIARFSVSALSHAPACRLLCRGEPKPCRHNIRVLIGNFETAEGAAAHAATLKAPHWSDATVTEIAPLAPLDAAIAAEVDRAVGS